MGAIKTEGTINKNILHYKMGMNILQYIKIGNVIYYNETKLEIVLIKKILRNHITQNKQ